MKKRYSIGGVALLGFLALLFLVLLGSTDSFDHYIYLKIISLRNPFFDVFFRSVTKLGNALPVACIALFLFCFLKKEERILLGSSLILTGIVILMIAIPSFMIVESYQPKDQYNNPIVKEDLLNINYDI